MTEMVRKVPVERAKQVTALPRVWQPVEGLRREIDRLFEGFDLGFGRTPMFSGSMFDIEPMWKTTPTWATILPVDVVEKDGAYEISAELPGLDEKDIEVKQTDGMLTIKGEKKEETEKKEGGYYLSERT